MTKNITTITASDVRDYFRADEKRMALLSPEARKTVEKGAKGRLHPEASEVNNKRRPTRQYVLGATNAANEKRAAQRKALADAGLSVGKRGPLSKVARQALATPKS